MNSGSFSGSVVLITGAAGGIGYSLAQRFYEEGAAVYAADVDAEAGADAVRSLQKLNGMGKVVFLKLDVTSEADWEQAVARITADESHLDILVNNAGINIRHGIEEMSGAEFDVMCAVNIKGPFLGSKYVLPVFRKQESGVIINMSSVCGLIGHKFTPEAYTATKGAVTLLTKSVAVRYGKFGIRCNAVHPSTVRTPLLEKLLSDPIRLQERIDEVPLGHLAELKDVAEAVLFLASKQAAFINGVSLPVDGGVTSS
jgi:cyclopentanol dehydrogenase